MLLGESAERLGNHYRDPNGDAGRWLFLAHAPIITSKRVQRRGGGDFWLKPRSKPAASRRVSTRAVRRATFCQCSTAQARARAPLGGLARMSDAPPASHSTKEVPSCRQC